MNTLSEKMSLCKHKYLSYVTIFNVHLKMGSGGNRNRLFSDLIRVENDESVEIDFVDARETPGRAIPNNQNSSLSLKGRTRLIT